MNWPDHLSNRCKDFILCSVTGLASADRYPQSRQRRYLNFNSTDFRLAEKSLTWHHFMGKISTRPSPPLSLHSPVVGEDAMFMTYCQCLSSTHFRHLTNAIITDEQIIAPMCSTTQALNGFQQHILSLALSCRDSSTTALCSSMLAIAAHHHQRPDAALAHKTGAVKGLHESLTAPAHAGLALGAEAQLATSMMLCMYNVSGRLEINWVNMIDWNL